MKKHLLILLSMTFALQADQLFFAFYNDFFAGKDQHFTSGAALCWLDEDDNNITNFDFTGFILENAKKLHINFDSSQNYNAGISLGQIMTTPSNTTQTTAQYSDIPYAGYLALSTYLFQWDTKRFFEYKLDIGVVGKESLGGDVQKAFHRMIGNSEPKGWATQLKTAYIANTMFRYGQKSWQSARTKRLSADWFNQAGFTLGKFNTSIFAGTMFRFGDNYIENFNAHYPYLNEEASLINLSKKHHGFGWSLNIGANVESLVYSYILDEAKKEGYKTDKNPLNFSTYFASEFYYDAHKFNFFYQSQSPYTKEQNTLDIFGGFMYAYQF